MASSNVECFLCLVFRWPEQGSLSYRQPTCVNNCGKQVSGKGYIVLVRIWMYTAETYFKVFATPSSVVNHVELLLRIEPGGCQWVFWVTVTPWISRAVFFSRSKIRYGTVIYINIVHGMKQWHNPKNRPFGANTTIGLKNITGASDKNYIKRGMFRLTSVPVLSDRLLVIFSSIVVLTPNGNFWVVPVSNSVSDMTYCWDACVNIDFTESYVLMWCSAESCVKMWCATESYVLMWCAAKSYVLMWCFAE